jgi:undecaprenyl-diphosphatase
MISPLLTEEPVLFDVMLLLKAVVMGLVEGLTELLPISSTGHLILTASLLGMKGEAVKVFEVAIQAGAMVAVMWEYRARLMSTVRGLPNEAQARRFFLNVVIAFIPAAVLGYMYGKRVKEYLFHPVPVATAFIVGGVIILLVEWFHKRRFGAQGQAGAQAARVETVDDMQPRDALIVGLMQCFALIPGTSRSGATIMGAMSFGFSRQCATQFSFFLGIPTLLAAGGYDLIKQRELLHLSDLPMFLVGGVVAFLSALVCIRWLIRYVSSHDFTVFAWYRIVFGALVLLTAHYQWIEWAN